MFRWLLNVHNVPVVDNISGNTNGNSGIPQPTYTVTYVPEPDYTLFYCFLLFIGLIITATLIYKLYETIKENNQGTKKEDNETKLNEESTKIEQIENTEEER
jgi:hypothetical protein